LKTMNPMVFGTSIGDKPLKVRLCEAHSWPPEQFRTRLFWRSLHRRAVPLARFIMLVSPGYFSLELAFIDEVGEAHNANETAHLIKRYRDDCRTLRNVLHERLRLRVSGRRLLALIKTLDREVVSTGGQTPSGDHPLAPNRLSAEPEASHDIG
jgi:hypothetical protein